MKPSVYQRALESIARTNPTPVAHQLDRRNSTRSPHSDLCSLSKVVTSDPHRLVGCTWYAFKKSQGIRHQQGGILRNTAVLLAALGCVLAGCSPNSDDSTSVATESSTSASQVTTATTTPAIAAPQYWLRENRDADLTVNVNGTYSDAQLQATFQEVRRTYSADKRGGAWFVQIDCGNGNDANDGARQGNGKFALDKLGAARTGLPIGGQQFEALPNRAPCPPNLPSASSQALTAQAVIDAALAAGLPATNARDNTGRTCQNVGCVQLITTDEFSAYQFADADKATKWASAFPSGYQNGLIFLRFAKDGSHPTDPALIPQYQAILDGLAPS